MSFLNHTCGAAFIFLWQHLSQASCFTALHNPCYKLLFLNNLQSSHQQIPYFLNISLLAALQNFWLWISAVFLSWSVANNWSHLNFCSLYVINCLTTLPFFLMQPSVWFLMTKLGWAKIFQPRERQGSKNHCIVNECLLVIDHTSDYAVMFEDFFYSLPWLTTNGIDPDHEKSHTCACHSMSLSHQGVAGERTWK